MAAQSSILTKLEEPQHMQGIPAISLSALMQQQLPNEDKQNTEPRNTMEQYVIIVFARSGKTRISSTLSNHILSIK
jgi:hypothetical protein